MSNLSHYTGTFLVGTHWFGVLFPKLQTFSEIFWVLLIDYSLYEKSDTMNFCLFVYFQSYNDKSKFSFLQTVQLRHNTSYLRTSYLFLRKILVSLFSSNILLYIEKNTMEKLCKVLEMELKMYTPVPKIRFWENQI